MEPESAAPEPSLPDLAAHRWPSAADWNPIGRSPRPSQTPATYFKRPYRNCPGQESWDRPPVSCRGSPDRDLTFISTAPTDEPITSRLPVTRVERQLLLGLSINTSRKHFAPSQRLTAQLTFVTLGFVNDIAGLGRQPAFRFGIGVVLSGIFAVAYAASGVTLRGKFWRAFVPLFALQMFIMALLGHYFPDAPHAAELNADQTAYLERRLTFDCLATTATVFLGYAGFVFVFVSESRRHIRVHAEKATLDAEMAAARAVLQVILPGQGEPFPGFTIDTAYQPAQQVGGDFLQILPGRQRRSAHCHWRRCRQRPLRRHACLHARRLYSYRRRRHTRSSRDAPQTARASRRPHGSRLLHRTRRPHRAQRSRHHRQRRPPLSLSRWPRVRTARRTPPLRRRRRTLSTHKP